ncbi:PREDICTED: probable phosphopantothenoylcysteine decarboxylase isoform X2 [Tarenaya hassleriana]|uniref:probable phosphopantothenoylcysteine decarboxylase isoform X2 n=1 Tax=Tarenaya hassleriana TaxID=28532 RepID=UPI00053C85C1|nr:PREDICTED: probable phosphopantothenoylcysteine decarboxylase isoform X2 [Tarenaya hassleriana]
MASSSSPYGDIQLNMRTFPSDKDSRRPHVLLAASGSVAAVKFEHLCYTFSEWTDVAAVVSKTALPFIGKPHFPDDVFVYTDDDEWFFWKKLGDPVLHIDLQKWADIMVIAPLSANTLAKITGGFCDNLLTSIVRAWDYEKPIFVAPAMNPSMWSNSFTEKHKASLEEMGINLILPMSSGSSSTGSMADISHIYNTIRLCWDKKLYQCAMIIYHQWSLWGQKVTK